MNQLYLGINLAAAMFLVSGNCAAFYATGGQVHNKNIRIVINFPPRLIKLLGLSADQKAQLQAILRKAESALLNVEMEKLRAMPGWQNAAMKTSIDEAAVKQRQGEVVASEAKRLQVNVEMFAQMRKVLTDEQVNRIRPELPLENNDFVVEVRLPEGFNDIGISGEQQSRLQAMVHSREPQMVALSRQAQARRIALEQAIFSERFDAAAVDQRREELIAVIAKQLEVNTGILIDARKILTAEQLKHLNELMP